MKAPASPTELAVALSRELEGRRITAVSKPPAERMLRIEFEKGRTLVIELMGKASNLLLLDEQGRILRFAHSHEGQFRRPSEGAAYQPPPASSLWISTSFQDLTEEQFRRIAAEKPAGGDGGASFLSLEDRLVARIPGFSPHIAREIRHRSGKGEEAWRVLTELRDRLASGHRDPILYGPARVEELVESVPLTSRVLFPFPFPLASAAGLTATPQRTVNEAQEAATSCLIRHMAFASLQASLASQMKRERESSSDLLDVLEAELSEAVSGEERDRRYGELILAGLTTARKQGSLVRVEDPYRPGGEIVEIPVDPRLDLKENAQRYFKSARRSARTRQIIPGRLERLRSRLAQLEAAAATVSGAGSREQLERLEREMQETGLVKAFRVKGRSEVGRKAAYVRVREYRSRDGFTILVGKTGAENDHLTFKVASPHDLWLHAAGYPGAHVLIRNPRRLAAVPEATVLEAAGIAAYYSKGRSDRALDVHVAWRRHVSKSKGMSPGMVVLKRHKTVRAAPALPRSPSE